MAKNKAEQMAKAVSAKPKAAPKNKTGKGAKAVELSKKPGRPYAERSPIATLIGPDARGSAWRNNLIKNLPANIEAVKKLTDDEVMRVIAYFGGENATTQAARAFDAALNERFARVRKPKAAVAA